MSDFGDEWAGVDDADIAIYRSGVENQPDAADDFPESEYDGDYSDRYDEWDRYAGSAW